MKHTSTPWQVHTPRKDIRTMFGGDTGIEILQPLTDPETGKCGGYQVVIGHVNCQSKNRILTQGDAEFIVKAVNNHDALLAALESVAASLYEAVSMTDENKNYNQRWMKEFQQAREAIAKATP